MTTIDDLITATIGSSSRGPVTLTPQALVLLIHAARSAGFAEALQSFTPSSSPLPDASDQQEQPSGALQPQAQRT